MAKVRYSKFASSDFDKNAILANKRLRSKLLGGMGQRGGVGVQSRNLLLLPNGFSAADSPNGQNPNQVLVNFRPCDFEIFRRASGFARLVLIAKVGLVG